MKTLTIRLPDDKRARLRQLATISIAEFDAESGKDIESRISPPVL